MSDPTAQPLQGLNFSENLFFQSYKFLFWDLSLEDQITR